ncbi:APH(3')-II family aminoglycoside O-phosphotransferase [Phyllobacterium sp. P30BS-XVII]|uniref:APH(3')-II family aminoglycoside O-phosphotransferase n=1 Tax=Phyllobacterium sp. P30BS-XVII TaxID=2587046 RepID=UPI0017A781F1|nr:APH(3') family aminoglycoside O-phosphotransferase [Phyllobacterium sp. P30BS-XVII]MBA8903988.1 aminoglycoside 3'-phosphotransferase-2 [Phyllobacterium sp. P30BS-XVII]
MPAIRDLPGAMVVPYELQILVSGYSWRRDELGRSDAQVFKLEASGLPQLFIKTELISPYAELPDEVARLQWLALQDMPCPRILFAGSHAGHYWLLMSALAGADLASADTLSVESRIHIFAGALHQLHALDPTACPFNHRLDRRIKAAKARMKAGLVDETDFDDDQLGRTATELFCKLLAKQPEEEDIVVTHGDACLPNFIAENGAFSGFIDCARLGIADRYQDIALACRSVTDNFGGQWVHVFLDFYGLKTPDPAKLAYYRLLDEFF